MSKKKEKEEVKKEVDKDTIEKRVVFPVGFKNINTLIGFNIYDEDTGELKKANKGILSGSLITYVGPSASGKSTLAYQHVSNMIRSYIDRGIEDAKIYIIDSESGMAQYRFKDITLFTDNEMANHVVFSERVTLDYLYDLTQEIIKERKTTKKIKEMGYTGDMIDIYPPVFIIIDAISELMPENLTEEELMDNKMLYMTQGRIIDQYLKKYKNLFKRYNINILAIAHKSKKVDMNAAYGSHPSRELKGMKADEKINGGKNFLFNTDIGIEIFKIELASKKDIEKKASYLGKDTIAVMRAKFIKSRQGSENEDFILVYDDHGFNPTKSFIYECVDLKIIETAGATRKLEGYEKTFRSTDMIPLFIEDENFRNLLNAKYNETRMSKLASKGMTSDGRKRAKEAISLMNE